VWLALLTGCLLSQFAWALDMVRSWSL